MSVVRPDFERHREQAVSGQQVEQRHLLVETDSVQVLGLHNVSVRRLPQCSHPVSPLLEYAAVQPRPKLVGGSHAAVPLNNGRTGRGAAGPTVV